LHSNNPVLSVFEQPARWNDLGADTSRQSTMSLSGTINTTSILLGLCMASAFAAVTFAGNFLYPLTIGGIIGGLVLGLIISFKPRTAPVLSPIYAIIEGAALGGISMWYQSWAVSQAGAPSGSTVSQIGDSIVFQAVLLTFGIAGAMLLAYSLRVIRATPMFVRVMSIMLVGYLISVVGTLVLGLFGVHIPFLHSTGPVGIAIAGGVVVLAAFTLILDFKVVEDGIASGAPKWMEWYAGFGILVTLVWLYLRVLRLLALLRRND
jgi:uncharacterized YccA/Bax inhibitor family protein